MLAILQTIYWTILGLIQIFQRHNAILVVPYIVFLFPIAYIQMFIFGVFGPSKEKRILNKAREKAKFDNLVEIEKKQIKNRSNKHIRNCLNT